MIVSGMTAPHRHDTPVHLRKLIRPWPVIAASVFGLLIVLGVMSVRPGAARPVTPAPAPRIAVLPVEAPPGVLNAGLAEIGQVLTESIIGKLQSMTGRHAQVLAKAETEALRGEGRTLAGVGRLGAQYFVDVSLRPTAGPVWVHAQLASVSGSILWSTDYELDAPDLESLELTVAQRIARRVAEEVVPSATRRAGGLTPYCRIATVAAMRVARRAGSQLATSAAAVSSNPAPSTTGASNLPSPNNSPRIALPLATDKARPMTSPATLSTMPSRSTMPSTLRGVAPRASRIPISRVRRATTYDLTP